MPNMLTVMNPEEILDIERAAGLLGVSTATVRNWVKCGDLKTLSDNGYGFYLNEIQKYKRSIEEGNLERLNGRANKSKAERTFTPDEYFQAGTGMDDITQITNFIVENKVDVLTALLLLSLNLLQKEDVVNISCIQDLTYSQNIFFRNKQIKEEILSWLNEIRAGEIKSSYSFLLFCPLPAQRDILGFIYQSLLLEGKKSQNGSY